MDAKTHERLVLVGTDFSPASRRAIRHATMLARRSGAALRVVHVAPLAEDAPTATTASAIRKGRSTARRLANHVRLLALDMGAKSVVRRGRPAEEILAEAAACDADLLVLGASGAGRWPFLGSTVRGVLERTSIPLLVVHKGDLVQMDAGRRIVAATDFSTLAQDALRRAIVLLDVGADDTVVLAHAFRLSPAVSLTTVPIARAELADVVRGELGELLDRQAQSLADLGVRPQLTVIEGLTVESLSRGARVLQADLLVAGTAGRTGLTRLLLGSTAERLCEHAPCPVLVMPPPAPATVEGLLAGAGAMAPQTTGGMPPC